MVIEELRGLGRGQLIPVKKRLRKIFKDKTLSDRDLERMDKSIRISEGKALQVERIPRTKT